MMRVSATADVATRLRAVWGGIDIRPDLPQVTMPTLVAHAREEVVIPFEEDRVLAAGIPGARLLSLDSRDHLPLADEPAWPVFLCELQTFLGTAPSPAVAVADELSLRERQVLRLVTSGMSNEQIAERLYLSARTVERHLSNSYAKLGLTGRGARAAAAAYVSRTSG